MKICKECGGRGLVPVETYDGKIEWDCCDDCNGLGGIPENDKERYSMEQSEYLGD
jgi:DnaJ-class molecular chaperone